MRKVRRLTALLFGLSVIHKEFVWRLHIAELTLQTVKKLATVVINVQNILRWSTKMCRYIS